MKDWLLVGAGGHAKVVADIIRTTGGAIAGYTALSQSNWAPWPYIGQDDDATDTSMTMAIGTGGVTPGGLTDRLYLLDQYRDRGFRAPALISPHATVSAPDACGDGTQIMAGAIVQAASRLDDGVLVNTGAIVEHDCVIGTGTHIAPGAIILGGCKIGACCMIGAGAIVLPGVHIPAKSMIAAGTRHS